MRISAYYAQHILLLALPHDMIAYCIAVAPYLRRKSERTHTYIRKKWISPSHVKKAWAYGKIWNRISLVTYCFVSLQFFPFSKIKDFCEI